MSHLVGTSLGQYQIVELIGEGGMADVYKAWQPSLRRYVALKVLAPRLVNDADFVKRFQQEAVSAANLNHTNIVTIHDVGTEGLYHYIAMEYIEGISLEQQVRSGQAFAPQQVVKIISQIGSALDYAHQRGFVHRDIKPANILVDATGRAVLTDFGIAKALSGDGATSALTQAGTIFGTPHYMSPEQIREQKLDHRSDLYSLGIVCYEMLSGQVPFDGTTTHSILYAQVHNPPPPLREAAGPVVPPPVEAVVSKMLAKERQQRYNSAGEFTRDLTQAVAGVWPGELEVEAAVGGRMGAGAALEETAISARRPAAPPRARRSRLPLALGLMALGVVVALAAVVVLVVLPNLQGEDPLEKGREALAAGDHVGAGVQFEQALEDDAGNVEALEGLLEVGDRQIEGSELDAAIETYKKALEYDADNVRALQGIGGAYEAKGEWGEAAGWYEKWTQVAPDDAEARLKLGWEYFWQRESERAVAEFKRVTILASDQPKGWEGLARSYLQMEWYDEALSSASEWMRRAPEEGEAYLVTGSGYMGKGDYEKASEAYKQYVSFYPNDTYGWNQLGWAYLQQSNYDEAEKAFAKSLELKNDDNHMGFYGLSRVYEGRKEYDLALDLGTQWLQAMPEDEADARKSLGWTYYNLKQHGPAVQELRGSLSIQPSSWAYYGLVQTYYYGLEDYQSALDASLEWISFASGDSRAHLFAGLSYRQLEQLYEAVASFQRSLDIERKDVTYYSLGRAYIGLDNLDKALQTYQAWLEFEPQNADAHANLGEVYALMDRCDQAERPLQEALSIDPENQRARKAVESCSQE